MIGCSHQVTDKAPPLPGEKKPAAPDTYVPKGMTPEQYLNKYYKLYIAGKFKESYKMLPGWKKERQTQQEYEQTHKSMPVETFKLGTKQEKGDNVVIEVKLKLKQYGNWTTSWHFIKKGKRYIVEDYSASGK